MVQSWRWRAACLGQDPELFFPYKETSGQASKAKAFCARCDVRAKCLEYAINTDSRDGIFGGLTAIERSLLVSGNLDPDYTQVGHRDKPGTVTGWWREKTAGIRPCDECRQAYNDYSREQQARYRKAAKCSQP